MPTNVRLANVSYLITSGAACGASTLVSVTIPSPLNVGRGNTQLMVLIVNPTSHVPLHVEPRAVFTDVYGTTQAVTMIGYLASNAQSFGGSAAQAQGLLLLISAQAAAIPLTVFAGSALRLALMPASALDATVNVSGTLSVWRV